MATAAQLRANRANALKGNGPTSSDGKAVSRCNSISHALRAAPDSEPVLPGEDRAPYVEFRDALIEEYQPLQPTASLLAERVASLLWRLRKVPGIEASLLAGSIHDDRAYKAGKKVRRIAHDALGSLTLLGTSGDPAVDLAVAQQEAAEVQRDGGDTEKGDCFVRVEAKLLTLTLYESRIQNLLKKTFSELERALGRERGMAVPPRLEVDVEVNDAK